MLDAKNYRNHWLFQIFFGGKCQFSSIDKIRVLHAPTLYSDNVVDTSVIRINMILFMGSKLR